MQGNKISGVLKTLYLVLVTVPPALAALGMGFVAGIMLVIVGLFWIILLSKFKTYTSSEVQPTVLQKVLITLVLVSVLMFSLFVPSCGDDCSTHSILAGILISLSPTWNLGFFLDHFLRANSNLATAGLFGMFLFAIVHWFTKPRQVETASTQSDPALKESV